jgi:hypothetical protein
LVANALMSPPVSAMITAAVRRWMPGIAESASTADASGRICCFDRGGDLGDRCVEIVDGGQGPADNDRVHGGDAIGNLGVAVASEVAQRPDWCGGTRLAGVLKDEVPYHDLGGDFFARCAEQQQTRTKEASMPSTQIDLMCERGPLHRREPAASCWSVQAGSSHGMRTVRRIALGRLKPRAGRPVSETLQRPRGRRAEN